MELGYMVGISRPNMPVGGGGSLPIAYSNVAGANSAGGTITFSQTIGSDTNRILVVGVSSEGSLNATDYSPSSVTYGGVALTKIASQDYNLFSNNATTDNQSMWYLLSPASGANNVVVTFPNAVAGAGAIGVQLFNAAQQAPETFATVTQQTSATVSCPITTLSNGAVVLDVFACVASTTNGVAGAGQTELLRQSQLQDCEMSIKTVATAGATTMSWSGNSSNQYCGIIAAAFKQA